MTFYEIIFFRAVAHEPSVNPQTMENPVGRASAPALGPQLHQWTRLSSLCARTGKMPAPPKTLRSRLRSFEPAALPQDQSCQSSNS